MAVQLLAAKASIAEHGLGSQKAQVVLVLDISMSADPLYQDGTMQEVADKAVSLGLAFDDDGKIPVVAFGVRAHTCENVTAKNADGYVRKFVTSKYSLEGGTNYAQALKKVRDLVDPKGDSTFVVFVTDGQCGDEEDTTRLIREMSSLPCFIQFVGVGLANFPYLEQLDSLSKRVVDNCGFCKARKASDLDFDKLLNEFPKYLPAARAAGVLR